MIKEKVKAKVDPDFIIIGTQRGGTTSLYNYLSQHSCILPPKKKETYFFDKNFGKGIDWYRSLFPTFEEKEKILSQHKVFATGESTPYYLFYPLAPKRIRIAYPGMKLIVLLRNPIDRAFSHYKLEASRNIEALAFEDALSMEKVRIEGKENDLIRHPDFFCQEHFCYSYLSKGVYVNQMERWLTFFPRKQLLVLKSEDFFDNPSKIYKEVLNFLGLPIEELDEYRRFNHSGNTQMSLAIRNKLVRYFKPHNEELYKLLNKDFGWDI